MESLNRELLSKVRKVDFDHFLHGMTKYSLGSEINTVIKMLEKKAEGQSLEALNNKLESV